MLKAQSYTITQCFDKMYVSSRIGETEDHREGMRGTDILARPSAKADPLYADRVFGGSVHHIS